MPVFGTLFLWEVNALSENSIRGLTRGQAFCKRFGDVLLSLAGLVLLAPLLLIIAARIFAEDGGPVIFRQERVTRGGRVFRICKFRTMRPEAYPGQPEEERVTKIGGFLRRTWLDELPQLWNVLAGDMSLVGPRPESLKDVARARSVCPDYRERERVRAGITGLAQLVGRYDTPPREKLALDMLYIGHYSPGFDLTLLAQTVICVFAKK